MQSFKPRTLNGRGFAHHLLLPVLVILAVAGIGSYLLTVSHAATASIYKGQCAQNKQLLQSAAANADATCTRQVQDLIDIYQYSATNHFAIGGKGETFNYNSENMVIMNGNFNGATQSAVNTFAKSPSLTNATSASSLGSWNTFCSTVSQKLGTAGFAHTTYDFSPGRNKASGYYIGSSGKTIFATVCGSPTAVSFSSGSTSGSSSSSSSSTACAKYTISTSSHGGAPAQCIYYLQSILNAAYQANSGNYTSVANNYDSFYKVSNGVIAGVTPSDNNYNNTTKVRIMAFQGTFNGSDGSNLSIDGVTGPATWGALCAVARTYATNPHNYNWIPAAQAAAKSGCSGTSGSVHQRSSAVLPGSSSSSGSTGGTSGGTSAGGNGGAPTITSFNFSLGSEDPNFIQNHNLYPDTYLATWSSQNSGNCFIVNGSSMLISNASYGASGRANVSLKAAVHYTITLTCVNANGSTSASKSLTAPTP